jgi:uncharacterized membrane protein (UPF0127 family)
MQMLISNHPDSSIDVVEARTPAARLRGLIGTNEVGRGKGLLLKAKQVHTFGMSYPIDVVHLGADGSILEVTTMKPFRLGRYKRKAKWILELDAGEAGRLGLAPGAVLERTKP